MVVIVPDVSILRIRSESAIYRLPFGSTASAFGKTLLYVKVAFIAGPPSPAWPEAELPAMVVILPSKALDRVMAEIHSTRSIGIQANRLVLIIKPICSYS